MKNIIISVLGSIATVQMDIWEVRQKGMFVCIMFIWLMITYAVDFKWQELKERRNDEKDGNEDTGYCGNECCDDFGIWNGSSCTGR